uniref:NB-ARC domain-containing protein n=1 Tax=Leersia perrieri TaxID=77586 RepID=A0A0D9W2P0_9ORYZ
MMKYFSYNSYEFSLPAEVIAFPNLLESFRNGRSTPLVLQSVGASIISKLVSKGFSYIGFDATEKVKQLEIKVLQLELALGLEIAEVCPHMNRLDPLLNNLKSAFYEAEDILDVEYHRLERQIQPRRFRRNWRCKIQSTLPTCSCLKSQDGSNTSRVVRTNISQKELEKCLANIENIVDEAHKILPLLNLPSHSNADKRETFGANSRYAVTTSAPPTVVIGRDTDRDKIIDMLYQNTGDSLTYSVIGIHGIPGSGKTTLAQHVCAREKMEQHFHPITSLLSRAFARL